MGIIHKPFYEDHHGIKCSKTYLGSVECGVFSSDIKDYMDEQQLYSIERSFHYLQAFHKYPLGIRSSYQIKVACTMNRFS